MLKTILKFLIVLGIRYNMACSSNRRLFRGAHDHLKPRLCIMSYLVLCENYLHSEVRGFVQIVCGKISVIVKFGGEGGG